MSDECERESGKHENTNTTIASYNSLKIQLQRGILALICVIKEGFIFNLERAQREERRRESSAPRSSLTLKTQLTPHFSQPFTR